MSGTIKDGGWLAGKKTYITAVLATLTAIGAYLLGEVGLAETLQVVATALIGAFLRAGVAKNDEKIEALSRGE